MASLISCPHCGTRPKEEFTIRGAADPRRPAANAPDRDWVNYVFIRDNPKGLYREFWHHALGCRRWLVVTRDTLTHDVQGVADAEHAAQTTTTEA